MVHSVAKAVWLAWILGSTALGLAAQSEPSPTRVVAIVGANVIPMDADRILRDHTVVVRDGVIAALGPAAAVELPAGAERIEARGMYLMPGLTDAHVHLRDPSELVSYLAHGVTTVVQLSGPSGNITNVAELRERVGRGDLIGPTIYRSGRILDGEPPIFPEVSTIVRTPDEAVAAVRAQHADGVDVIKVYNNLRTEVLEAVTSAAHERGLSVWGHVPRIDGRKEALQRALAAGLDVIAHGEEVFFTMLYQDVEAQLDRGLAPTVDRELLAAAVRLIAARGATVIPNLSFVAMTRAQLDGLEQVWMDPEAAFLHPSVLRTWKEGNATTRTDLRRFDLRERGKQIVARDLTRALNDAGVPLLLGTDASAPGMFPGKSACLELEELVGAGLTPYQALATGSRNPGMFFQRHGRVKSPFGTVTVGSRADLVLLQGDPLTLISNVGRITGVMTRGQWYARSHLDRLRAR